MAKLKRQIASVCEGRCGETGTLTHYWWECKMVKPLWKTDWQIFSKLKTELPYDLAIPLLEIYLREMKTYVYTCSQHYSQQPKSGKHSNIH